MTNFDLATSVKILGYFVTASLLLPTGIPDYAIPLDKSYMYVDVEDSRPSYDASVLSFPSKISSNILGSTLPIRGTLKVKIRNTRRSMEWN
jgi:hypothetical protein